MKVGDYVKKPYKFPKQSGWLYYKVVEVREDGSLSLDGISYKTGMSRKEELDSLVPMTEEDIQHYQSEVERIERNRRETEARRNVFLEKIGLSRSDFCRFRDIYEEEGMIVVCTRENGGNCYSINAAKSPLCVDRKNDEYDSTYAYWYFKTEAS